MAIQYAKLSGYCVITTCSPRGFDFVRSLGADHVFDYSSPSFGTDINKLTKNALKYCWDTISISFSATVCAEAFSTHSPEHDRCRYGAILDVKPAQNDLHVVSTVMYTFFNESFIMGSLRFPAMPKDLDFARDFFALSEKLIADRKLRPQPETVGQEGLRGALQSLKELRNGNISATKLVYRVEDTPDGEASINLG